MSAHFSRTPPPPLSPSAPNYKLEIQDGQGVGVEVIKPESLGLLSTTTTTTNTYFSSLLYQLTPTLTLWPSLGRMALIPRGSPPRPGQQSHSQKWPLSC